MTRRTPPIKKMFIVRKYVMAKSAKGAILLEKNLPVDDVWLDEDWKKNNPEKVSSGGEVGFRKK